MFHLPTVWVDNTPNSLLDIVVRYCIKNENIFTQINEKHELELINDLKLQVGVCERMLTICKAEMYIDFYQNFLTCFRDSNRTHLKHIDLSDTMVTDNFLDTLTRHSIVELNISNCSELTVNCLSSIAKLGNSLGSLTIGSTTQIFLYNNIDMLVDPKEQLMIEFPELECQNNSAPSWKQNSSTVAEPAFYFPKLCKLVIHGLRVQLTFYFENFVKSAEFLTYLDISKCSLEYDDLECLVAQKQLTTLIMFDVTAVSIMQCLPVICQLKSLRHLDISHSGEIAVNYPSPNKTLKYIVDSLEDLLYLDISGTNLAGRRTRERESSSESLNGGENLTDIPGLASRVNRPLDFLGLLNTVDEACFRHHIPAKRIAGEAAEDQILTAGQAYCKREGMIQKVLNDLFQIFRFSSCRNTKLALDIVMESMRLHPRVKHIQVSGSASLFYIVRKEKKEGEEKTFFNPKMRQKIIKVLVDAMDMFSRDDTMVRNACLSLIHFKIPEDVYFYYEKLVNSLLDIVSPNERHDEFVQRIGLYLLNSLACQVDGFHKKLVGDRGAITIMLRLIEERLQHGVCDEVMETAWSTMWNVTDETSINCARFLEGNGMDLFLLCLQAFPDKPELLRNMMGLLGNVAEVKELRQYLMKDEYLTVFSDLLGSRSDGIEVSYNAAGILSHIASDGEKMWSRHNIVAVRRKDVLAKMVEEIDKWDLDTKRNINYRSFEPILRLLNVDHTPEVQHWAVWALANLTKVYPAKYCLLLKDEDGLDMLTRLKDRYEKLTTTPEKHKQIIELAKVVIDQCEGYENSKREDSACDDIEIEEA